MVNGLFKRTNSFLGSVKQEQDIRCLRGKTLGNVRYLRGLLE